jgi:parallel beta-helix repeat protein
MKFIWRRFAIIALLWAFSASAAVRYVDLNSGNPVPPYTNWITAATVIQDAIDAASDGDQVLVTNGVYQIGGRRIYSTITNRVAVDKAITVQSINGAAVTLIVGSMPSNAVRCAYLTNNAVLIGFTLTNGAADGSGGGAWCEVGASLVNCVVISNLAPSSGGGVYHGTCDGCTIANNRANFYGGGAYGSTLKNCTLSGNRQTQTFLGAGGGAALSTLSNCVLNANNAAISVDTDGGGGAFSSTLIDCLLISNTTANFGGGAIDSNLKRCTIISNSASAHDGGGVCRSVLDGCTLIGNSAFSGGGGARLGSLTNCTLSRNTAGSIGGGTSESSVINCRFTENYAYNGGGAFGGTLVNCVVVSNSAFNVGAGVYAAYLTNCTVAGNSGSQGGGTYGCISSMTIVYSNMATFGPNYDPSSVFAFCCTTPLPSGGPGNIDNPPKFVGFPNDVHLQSDSPCINAGNNAEVMSSSDFDGNPRISGGTVDIGAYEFQSPTSILSYAWAQQYGLPTDGTADHADSDADGSDNWHEWIAGTIPVDALSVLKMFAPSKATPGLKISWQSVNGRTYFLQRSSNLAALPAFSTLQSNVVGQVGSTVFTDTTATNGGPYFYRVGISR